MALTVQSGASAYATIDDLSYRFDVRPMKDLVVDDESPAANLTGNAVLTALLKEASGKVEAAFLMGGKYTAVDLQALASSATNGREFLAGIVCALAYGLLIRRRGDAEQDIPPEVAEANQLLNAAVEGKLVLPFTETLAAGVMSNYRETPEDVVDRDEPTYQAEPLFGLRNNRRRPRE